MASEPRSEHSFILDSFEEFEALARRALHKGRLERDAEKTITECNVNQGLSQIPEQRTSLCSMGSMILLCEPVRAHIARTGQDTTYREDRTRHDI